ncbi:YdeI/OmpD-associated family protein [Cellulophaga omnivescoria]|uniref:YdeI/OmpD-associated family protein n=1 Tax=Cellulophaga omnivescoria TaxID=1888890 RepID=UPI003EB73328
MTNVEEFYFKNTTQWRAWLLENHNANTGIHLILYKVGHKKQSMRWEDAVKVALCFGWIDSTVKSLGDGKRRQYFCPRKPKSVWSKVNKTHIKNLIANKQMHKSGLKSIEIAKENGSWTALDDVENGVLPTSLQKAFNKNPNAFSNYNNFAPSYKKGYLYYLNQAKREETKQKRIAEIIKLCDANIKSRNTW